MRYNIQTAMNFLKKNIRKILLIAFLIMMPVISFAGDTDIDPTSTKGKIVNPLASKGIDSVQGFIKVLLEGALKIGIPLIALAIIYCGFLFVAAIGNSEKLKKAKDALLYTLIGSAILLGSWAIAGLIANTVLVL